ncbi:MAG: protein-export chaperone SecB [Cellvibrionales bacterium]|jgi:preprotein translocase subunit SecB|nr:protein-export chaperone SecB [Cellvibrionales bacterium]MBK8676501.1 protein-export chaperone SecB [Cellvibrionales bacterium]HRG49845.1 protein-export chaperone SecB [Pseudomonadales bacterium]
MADEAQQQFGIQRIYVKDVSFESPQGVALFNKQIKPSIEQELSTAVTTVAEDHYEVVLTVTVTAKEAEQVLFLVEVQQAGIFGARGFSEEQLRKVTTVNCPTILFPYARQLIDSLLQQASLPPLLLPPVNFDVLLQQSAQDAVTTH